jgi:hypothetical protein
MRVKICLGLLGLALFASAPVAIAADTVLRVVVVETNNIAEYMKQLERGKAIMKDAGSTPVLRVWQALYAGPNAGQIVVSVEYPGIQAFANDSAKLRKDPTFAAWLKGLEGVRKIVSDSLYEEM